MLSFDAGSGYGGQNFQLIMHLLRQEAHLSKLRSEIDFSFDFFLFKWKRNDICHSKTSQLKISITRVLISLCDACRLIRALVFDKHKGDILFNMYAMSECPAQNAKGRLNPSPSMLLSRCDGLV